MAMEAAFHTNGGLVTVKCTGLDSRVQSALVSLRLSLVFTVRSNININLNQLRGVQGRRRMGALARTGSDRKVATMSKDAGILGINPEGASSFEHRVASLRLSPAEYVNSAELKEWVRRNKDHRYVPPELLAAWGFTVNVYAA